MSSKKVKIILSWILVAAWMAVIFIMSSQKDTQSQTLSGNATGKIAIVLKFVTFGKYDITAPENVSAANNAVRKTAHIAEYFILALFVINAFKRSGLKRGRLVVWSAFVCMLYSLSDEFHQLFVQGRAMRFEDFIIDSAGILMGISLMYFLVYSKKFRV